MHSRNTKPEHRTNDAGVDPARRRCLLALGSAVALAAVGSRLAGHSAHAAAAATGADGNGEVLIMRFSAAGARLGEARMPKVVKTPDEWREQLSRASFVVTRRAGTEAPFSGEYWNSEADGLYRCICCGTALYDSRTKFHSGTGWPSFWQPIAHENVTEHVDHGFAMTRTAISCTRCDAHLGHVFNDGPPPTGLRYCMNSVALHFVARATT